MVARMQLATRQTAEVARIERKGMAELMRFVAALRLRAQKGIQVQPTELVDLKRVLTETLMAVHILGVKRVGIETGIKRPRVISASTLSDVLKSYRGMTQWELDELEVMYGAQTAEVLSNLTVRLNDGVRDALVDAVESGLTPTAAINRYFSKLGLSENNAYYYANLFRTQTQLAYQTAQYTEYQEPHINEMLWGYEYVTVGDDRVRDSHAAMNGTRLRKDDPKWQSMWPPNGYNCRCTVLPILNDDPKSLRTVSRPPGWAQPDAGFEFNPAELTGIRAPTDKIVEARRAPSGRTGSDRLPSDVRALYPELSDAELRKKFPKIMAKEDAPSPAPVVVTPPAPPIPIPPAPVTPPVAPPPGVRKGKDRLPSDLRAKYPELSDAELRKKFPKIMAKPEGGVVLPPPPKPAQSAEPADTGIKLPTKFPAHYVDATVPKRIEVNAKYDPGNKYHVFGEKLRREHAEKPLTEHERAVEIGSKVRSFVTEAQRAGINDQHKELFASRYKKIEELKAAGVPTTDKRISSIYRDIGDIKNSSSRLRAEYTKQTLAGVRSFGKQSGGITTRDTSAKDLPHVKEAAEWIPSGWLTSDVKVKSGNAGWFNSQTMTIQLGRHLDREAVATAAHELLHACQYDNAVLRKLENDFFAKRIANDTLTPIKGGNVGAVGYKDDFTHHYMGRVYQGSDIRELLTMIGEEVLHGIDHGVYYNDQESYDFIAGLLALGG
jgi:SPP1 gp7 family putative phage head morphogenesis protein